MKQINKLETIEIKALPLRSRIHLPAPWVTGKEVLQVSQSQFGYGTRAILKDVKLNIERGQKIGVVGYLSGSWSSEAGSSQYSSSKAIT